MATCCSQAGKIAHSLPSFTCLSSHLLLRAGTGTLCDGRLTFGECVCMCVRHASHSSHFTLPPCFHYFLSSIALLMSRHTGTFTHTHTHRYMHACTHARTHTFTHTHKLHRNTHKNSQTFTDIHTYRDSTAPRKASARADVHVASRSTWVSAQGV
jgi:hypothetical protein